ncbi:hypothetical protein L2E82_16046 [Cichorium intybus]|uniref:Uncharacterized protein n=1 Tax=Cichorium intybus TaxID=13427 RepID=A0ACB9F3T7_CICIN|nr:hypothetical protein L2E82_16046 [Cichorium intybus]
MSLNLTSLFITLNNIYESKEKTENGEPDWYGVLGLKKPATLEKICEKYCKLRQTIEEVRNEVIGAEGALQILSEAFCMLTQTFWTKCSSCQFQFQYSNFRINEELVCINCRKHFLAVPLTFGNHPLYQKTMPYFTPAQQGDGAVLALTRVENDVVREPSKHEIRVMLMHKARAEILKQLYG